jgi:hypothetical protein
MSHKQFRTMSLGTVGGPTNKMEACSCPACGGSRASQPRAASAASATEQDQMTRMNWSLSETRRWNAAMQDPELRAYAQSLIDERLARGGAPETPDLRAAVEARHATTSKNITGWKPGQRPEPQHPERPAGSPFTDQLARDKFEVEELVDAPPSLTAAVAARRAHDAAFKAARS